MENFQDRLDTFVKGCQAIIDDNYTKHFQNIWHLRPILEVSEGKRYVKIIANSASQRSAYVFVDKTNGDVLKTASWNAPAKGARGNIFDAKNGLGRMSPYGAGYNR